MADLLVDTDVFVDHLRGAVELTAGRHRLHYSVITRAELFAGATGSDLAARVLLLHQLYAGEALQLAAGLLWADGRAPGHHFVCLDKRLREAAEREGFEVLP